jgi:hypothetical protein
MEQNAESRAAIESTLTRRQEQAATVPLTTRLLVFQCGSLIKDHASKNMNSLDELSLSID